MADVAAAEAAREGVVVVVVAEADVGSKPMAHIQGERNLRASSRHAAASRAADSSLRHWTLRQEATKR